MFDLHVVQAEFGDALIVSYGTTRSRRHILVDGGPTGTYEAHLRGVLTELVPSGKKIDLAILSHIDNDHVKGMLDLFTELEALAAAGPTGAAAGGKPTAQPTGRRPGVAELWHNTFSVSAGGADIAPRIREALALAG